MKILAQLVPAAALAAALALAPAPARAVPLRAVPQPAAAPALADTPAAKVAAAFLSMLNDGSKDSVSSFETSFASDKRAAGPAIPERVSRVAEMRRQWGSFTVKQVVASTASGITLRVGITGGDTIEMEFQLSTTQPGKLDTVLITSSGPGDPPAPITAELRSATVEAAAAALEAQYVYPNVAADMAKSVRAKLAAGEYDSLADDASLARRLSEDLRAVSHDLHLRVRVAPPSADLEHGGPALQELTRENFGFKKVEVLEGGGNIGYIRFDGFRPDQGAKDAAAAALAFVSHCDALIFDLRFNGGGDPEMVRFITGYLFDEPAHLNDMIDRDGKTVGQSWSLKDVPGKRFPAGTPVYVLTSSRTFSCAEEFCYDLQNLDRATIVGEKTGGGAHPTRPARLNDRFVVNIPYRRAHNPVSRTNWEGTGVEPDVVCPATDALDTAADLARKAIETKK